MKKIKINFVDFWDGFDKKDNFFYKTLSEKFEVIITDKPDYLFYSVFGVEHKKSDCIKIFYTGECVSPNFQECDYALGFDYLTFEDRYYRLPNYLRKENDIQLVSKKHIDIESEINNKEGFCCFCYSNAGAKERNYFFRELSKYKKVDSGGSVFNNIGYQVGDGRYNIRAKDRDSSKIEWQRKYKFCIAFENTSYRGYTTEKLPQAFAAQTIPIYWGNPLIEKEFNGNAFINCHNYNNFNEVIEMIKKIDNDDELYAKMLSESAWNNRNVEEQVEGAKYFLESIFLQPLKLARRRYRSHVIDLLSRKNENIYSKQIVLDSIQNGYIGKGFELELLKSYYKRIRK